MLEVKSSLFLPESDIAIAFLSARDRSTPSMATTRPPVLSYENLPPFPENVPLAPLFRVSLDKLLANDEEENGRLFEACKTLGFFYLELGDSEYGHALKDGSEDLLRLSQDAFIIPQEVKMEHTFAKMRGIFGWVGQ